MASARRQTVADGVIRPCGQIGHNSIVALTEDDLETLRAQLNAPAPSPAAV